ncbi:MAG: electron transfer flavoprotein subunit beta/FixA family protein [Nitrososphaerota archaeon]|nr:electron transfer flavoprotein subunit beta/FixA family protein [Candidatus Bathyarchaeota archaeon]MCX8161841.1 electron transfer flavoprotein subunit beta/FixA family protein [Candidatus Bathyarchaeota archaeon]MDW8061849.1 electron transfer flavoprotein subunit beta/FixA family protein [Nitrososphaerota archaeon]
MLLNVAVNFLEVEVGAVLDFHVIVLIKHVPDIEKVKFDVETGRIDRSSAPGEINPFDLNAIETAVQLKEKLGGIVTALSMGPPQAESSLRDAIARGVDRAILLSDHRFAGADTLATSYTLASAIRKIGRYDLIVCGEKTVDGDTGQVGPEVAEHLGIPHVAYVCEIRESYGDRLIVVSDMGDKFLVEVRFPALITVTKDVNTPRLPSLRDILKARRSKVEVWDADSLLGFIDMSRIGLLGSRTQVFKIVIPSEERRRGIILKGVDSVNKLIEALRMEGFI